MTSRRLQTVTLSICALLGALTLFPSNASADLYQYVDANGTTFITSTKRSDLKLVRVIEGPKTPKKSSKSGGSSSISPERYKRFESYRQEANEALANSTANHDVPDNIDERSNYFDDIIAEAAKEYDLPFAFIKAVIRIESGFRPDVISYAGAMGLMQLMPRTAELMNVQDPFDPRENIFGGTKYLRLLCNRYDGNINLILAAYNAGDGAVARYNGIPYPQTRDYVKKIDSWYRIYSAATPTP